uniref:Uncharacterized protein n=1 Tax=Triticum urartu TaxID=4572 RepID=A0A8R7V649_TRIUA
INGIYQNKKQNLAQSTHQLDFISSRKFTVTSFQKFFNCYGDRDKNVKYYNTLRYGKLSILEL